MFRSIPRLLKPLVRFSPLLIITWGPKDTELNPRQLWCGAFYYCRSCRKYRFDDVVDPMSKAARVSCGNCGISLAVSEGHCGPGMLFFNVLECIKVAKEHYPNPVQRRIMKFKFMTLGLGKYLPDDRGGRTASELEFEAFENVMFVSINAFG